jgi:hypothetical protein
MALTFGQWTFTVDRDATEQAYAQAPVGGADSCECAGCRNFRIARSEAFPDAFIALLDGLGIDSRKDAEVYDCGRIEDGVHVYGGWFHFVGRLEETGGSSLLKFGPYFSAHLTHSSAPRLSIFKDAAVVQLDFESTAVPWLLTEPDPG